jgi:hypothetical protein
MPPFRVEGPVLPCCSPDADGYCDVPINVGGLDPPVIERDLILTFHFPVKKDIMPESPPKRLAIRPAVPYNF